MGHFRINGISRRITLTLLCGMLILMLVLGVVILVNPFSSSLLLLRFIGISMLLEAVCDLVGGILFSRVRRGFDGR